MVRSSPSMVMATPSRSGPEPPAGRQTLIKWFRVSSCAAGSPSEPAVRQARHEPHRAVADHRLLPQNLDAAVCRLRDLQVGGAHLVGAADNAPRQHARQHAAARCGAVQPHGCRSSRTTIYFPLMVSQGPRRSALPAARPGSPRAPRHGLRPAEARAPYRSAPRTPGATRSRTAADRARRRAPARRQRSTARSGRMPCDRPAAVERNVAVSSGKLIGARGRTGGGAGL